MKINNTFKDLTGNKFNKLLVVAFVRVKNYIPYWKCLCDCGTVKIIEVYSLLNGNSQSCGCYRNQKSVERFTTHGMSKTNFYDVWSEMKNRCLNPKSKAYRLYGVRGITVCNRWLTFENFRDDMYESYLKHVEEFGSVHTQLDRINNKGNYQPSNCKWATKKEQSWNREIATKTNNYKQHLFFKHILSSHLRTSIFRNHNTKLFLKRFGCTMPEFKHYIESKFQEGMAWDNHGQGFGFWEFDHVKECHEFDLSKKEDRLTCFHYTNFQPLWWPDNLKKAFSIYPK